MDAVTLEDDVPCAARDACACAHWFSFSAWRSHCAESLRNCMPAALLDTTCIAAPACRERLRPRVWRAFLEDDLWDRAVRAFAISYAQHGAKAVRPCPSPGCELVVECGSSNVSDATVRCSKGHSWCFGCGKDPHAPALCADFARWLKTECDEGANAKWLTANTKCCPKW